MTSFFNQSVVVELEDAIVVQDVLISLFSDCWRSSEDDYEPEDALVIQPSEGVWK